MSQNLQPAITALFAGPQPRRELVNFVWRLVRRGNRPFLLLPEKSGSASVGFELYSAHRPLAKLWRSMIPLMLQTSVSRFFDRVAVQADAGSELMQFLARQSGLPAGQLSAPTVKFGGAAGKTSRLVLLLCDAGGHPVRVIKAGLDPQGRTATEREADLLSRWPANITGCMGISGRFSSPALSAFATGYFGGASPGNDLGFEKLFHDWLNGTPPEPIGNLESWRELALAANGAGLLPWPALRDALAGRMVRTTIFHGDFAPRNVRLTGSDNIRAFDWERGHLKGIPAWDWFHFVIQNSILVKRHSPESVAAEMEQLIRSPRFQKYAADAGITPFVEPLLLAYFLDQKLVTQPLAGGKVTDRLFQILWAKWHE